VRGLAHKIDSGDAEQESNCVLLREGNGPKVFCFYGVLLYKDLADSFTSDVSIYGVFLQDEIDLVTRGDVNAVLATLKSVENIVDLYIESIKVLQPNGPYYICGESFGGIVALETARKLEAFGEEVRFVGMFDTWHPSTTSRGGMRGKIKSLLAKILQNSSALKRIGGSSDNTETEQEGGETSQDYRRGVRAQARNLLLKNYVPTLYASPINLFTAQDRPASEQGDNTLGWSKLLPALEVTMVPGDHLGILKTPNTKVIAQKIEQILAK
jgi:thioesterase domain-containing protein